MRYELRRFAARNLGHVENRKLRHSLAEQRLIELFFERQVRGFFVEVGANDPILSSQTWHLEQKGWHGVLIEPIPELCAVLRARRPGSVVVQAACGAPEQRGPTPFHVAEALSRSTLERNTVGLNVSFTRTEIVELKTLDDILREAGAAQVDFVSIDVEGLQLNVLRGFDLEQYRPRLLLVEHHLHNPETHRHLQRHGYRLVKRTGRNSWYLPRGERFVLRSPGGTFAAVAKGPPGDADAPIATAPQARAGRAVALRTKHQGARSEVTIE